MLCSGDQYTSASLFRLEKVTRGGRPIVFWIGAGASRWAGLPSWHDSARKMRKLFAANVPNFPDATAESHIASEAYPDLFEMCKEVDLALFNSALVDQFSSPELGPVYRQLINGLKEIAPLQVVTTNVDLCLEQCLGPIDVIERGDLERCSGSILSGSPFIGKLHGSVSAIRSVVFAESDYAEITSYSEYMAAVKSLFSLASVVFLGYGLRDRHILKLIAEITGEHPLFGAGPHFLLTGTPGPQENQVYRIGYTSAHHQDHRGALTVFNFIAQHRKAATVEFVPAQHPVETRKSETGFFVSYFAPSGTHITGYSLELARPGGEGRINAIMGLGFAEGELPSSNTVAFHDLAVGLTCFDHVFLPLHTLGVLHERATSEVFWELIRSEAISFVDVIHNPFYVANPESVTGEIALARVQDPEHKETRSSMSEVRKMLRPATGKEEYGQKLIESLESRISVFDSSERLNLPGMVRDALHLPQVSKLLGYSDYILPDRIPHWLAYPTLRFAHLIQTALICDQLNIGASRVPFGGASLLSAAYSLKSAEQTVFDYASFVLAGAFGANLSDYFERNPRLLLNLIKFRGSAEGGALRREVSDRLETSDGAEFSVAVDGSLKAVVPGAVLQAARNKYSALMKASIRGRVAEVIWGDTNTGDSSLRLWRERSREILLGEAKRRGVRRDSPCLCGSGDSLSECCVRSLR